MKHNHDTILSFAGDLCLQYLHSGKFTVDPQVAKIFASSNLSLANLEAPLTTARNKTPNQPYYLKAPPESNQIIEMFDIFSLANNHILDYGEIGLTDTCSCLAQLGKKWFGAGPDRKQAWQPCLIKAGEINFAFLGFTRWYNAKPNQAGTTPEHYPTLKKIIRNLKKQNYFVVIFPHWNYEYVDYPPPAAVKRARSLIESGADLIIGAHPHQIQGWEIFKHKSIFYSMGNFIFPEFDLSLKQFSESLVVSIHINPADLSYRTKLHPVCSTDSGLDLMQGDKLKAFAEKLQRLSVDLQDPKRHRRLFYHEAASVISATMNSLEQVGNGQNRWLNLTKRLPRARKEDVYLQVAAIWQKLTGSL